MSHKRDTQLYPNGIIRARAEASRSNCSGEAARGGLDMMKRHPWLVLVALLFLHVIAHIDRNMLLGFSPQITAELALSNTQFGFLVGAVWVLSFGFMAPFLGSLADRYSRPRIMAAG